MASLTHEQAMQRFNDAGVGVRSSSGIVTSDRTNPRATSLQGVQEDTINGIINLREQSGLNIVVTGGTETGHTDSHSQGYKLDIRKSDDVDRYIQENFTKIASRWDGKKHDIEVHQYRDSYGNIYADESYKHHWDIKFSGNNPEPIHRESNANQRDAGVPDEPEPHYDANPPMGTPPENEPNPPDMGVPTESNPPDMSAPAESHPSDMGTPSDMSMPGDGGQAHDAETNFSLPDGSQISVPTDIQNFIPADAGHNLTPVDAGENYTPADANRNVAPPEVNQSVQSPEVNQSMAPPELNQSVAPPELSQSIQPPELNQSVAPPDVNQSIQPPEVNQSMALPDNGYDAGSSSAEDYDSGSSDAGGYDGGSSNVSGYDAGSSDAGDYDAGSSDDGGASEGGAEGASHPR